MNRSTLSRLAFTAATATTVVGAATGADVAHRFAKPLIVPSLALGLPRSEPVLGLALGAATLGDVLLLDPDDDGRILLGAAAFAVMQGCYCSRLLHENARLTAGNAAPRLAGWAAAATMLFRRSPSVAPGLAGYGALLTTMATLAADRTLAPKSRTLAGVVVPDSNKRSRLALGGILFTASDALIVVRRLFLRSDRGRRVAEGGILASYAVAQLLLVEALAGQ